MGTQKDVANRCGISVSRVAHLVRDGVLPKSGRGEYDVDLCFRLYQQRMRDTAAGRRGKGDLDLTAERARKAKEEADRLELENAVRRGELLERSAVDEAAIGAFSRVRAKLLAIPGKVAPVCATITDPNEVYERVEQEIHYALTELSEASFVELAMGNEDMVAGAPAAAEADRQ